MKRFSLVISFILACCVACSEPEISTLGSIAGVVVDAASKDAIQGVKVTLTPGGSSQLTGKDGTFTFEELESQEYTLSFTKDSYETETQKVMVRANISSNVQIALNPLQPALAVSSNVLSFGNETSTLAIDITNTGKGVLKWNVSENIEWISCSPEKGETEKEKSTLVVTADRSKLEQGNFSESFVIGSNGGSATIVVSISVNGIKLAVEPSELDFGTLTNAKQLQLVNTGTGSLRYTASTSKSWLSLSKENGSITTSDYITAIVSREGLSAGHYDASIIFSTSGGEVSIPVKMDVAVNETPTVTAESVSDVKYNSALLHGTVVSVGSDKITRYGFCWSEKTVPTIEDNYSNLGDCTTAEAFESIANNLKSETKYYFRAYAENSVGLVYSEKTLYFTTSGLPSIPSVVSGTVDNITATSARAKGTLSSLGNVEKITHYGHVWGTSAKPILDNAKHTDLGEAYSTASFISEVSGLSSHTTYYIRAYATNEKGTAYGEDVTFVTSKTDAKVSTSEVTEIVHNAATCGGVISDTGGHTISEKGVCFGKSAMPTVNDSKQTATSGKDNSFTCRITGLEKETTYYVRAYVKTSDNTVFYGDDKAFKTTKEVTLPTLSAVSISNIQTTSATFVGAITSDGNSEITECGFCWSDVAEPTIVDNKTNCDPQSKEMGKNITSLTEGTKYFLRAFAKNAMGYAYSEVASFETLSVTTPVLSAPILENIGKTTADASTVIESNGNTTISEAGFCWSVSPNPTVYDNRVVGSITNNNVRAKLTGLPGLSTVHVRAFAINSKGTGYSDSVTIQTSDSDVDVWDGTIATTFGGGSGTESDPIIIETGSQLALLANNVNAGYTYGGIYFKLVANINLSGIAWTAIGNKNNPFAGAFDGNLRTISGLSINNKQSYMGLFGNSIGTLKNINVEGSIYGDIIVGGICGYNSGTIYNCAFRGLLKGADDIGGICGRTDGIINGCKNSANIQATGSNIGGIVGNCYLNGPDFQVTTGWICNSYNSGDITSSGSKVGGIAGQVYLYGNWANSFVTINNNLNSGKIRGDDIVGGCIGYLYSNGYYGDTSMDFYNNISNCEIYSGKTIGGFIATIFTNTSSTLHSGAIRAKKDYWLFDVAKNQGIEIGVASSKYNYVTESYWYTRNSNSCIIDGGGDLCSRLNDWVDENSTSDFQYYRWEYRNENGVMNPSLTTEK